MTSSKLLGSLALAALSVSGLCSFSNAQDIPGTPLKSENPSDAFLEWLGQWNKLYKADKKKNPVVQEVNLGLRMQYQAGWTSPNGKGHSKGGGHDDGFRRFYLGGNAKLFDGKLKIVNTWEVGGVPSGRSEKNDWHQADSKARLYELKATYTAEPVDFTLGKIEPSFTSEWRTSSAAILTVERSALINQLRSETNWGMQVNNSDKKDKVGWLLGGYLNAEGGNYRGDELEFNENDNGFVMGQVNYDTSGFITEKGRIGLDYVHNFARYTDKKRNKAITESTYRGPGAQDIVALSWDMQQGKWSFVTELLAGFNVENPDTKDASHVMGFIFMPSYKISPNWEAVCRYQFSTGDDAVKVEKRYETITTTSYGFADSMQALYLGVNYYVDSANPNMMKIMAGAEYSNYKNDKGINRNYTFTGWTYYLAFRTNF